MTIASWSSWDGARVLGPQMAKQQWPVNFDSFGLNFKYPSGNAITQQLTTSIYFLLESVTNWSRFGQWIGKFRVGPLSMQFKDVQCPLERRGMPYFCFFTCIARLQDHARLQFMYIVYVWLCIAYVLHMHCTFSNPTTLPPKGRDGP